MALKPILHTMNAFDARNGYTFTFGWSGDLIAANELTIVRLSDGKIVYQKQQTEYGMVLKHTLAPQEAAFNDQQYSATLKVFRKNGSDYELMGEASDPVLFWCLTAPSFSFSNSEILTGELLFPTITVDLKYSQAKGELLSEYQIMLYNQNQTLIDSSGVVYAASVSAYQYTFAGLDDKATYYVRALGATVNGYALDTGMKQLKSQFDYKGVGSTCILENLYPEASIRIQSNYVVTTATYEPAGSAPVFVDHTKVDLTKGGAVTFIDGFELKGDYEIKLALESIQPNHELLRCTDTAGNGYTLALRPFFLFPHTPDGRFDLTKGEKKFYFLLRDLKNGYEITDGIRYGSDLLSKKIHLLVQHKNSHYKLKIEMEETT